MNAIDICCGLRVFWRGNSGAVTGFVQPAAGTVTRTATRTFDPESIITVELDGGGGVVEVQPHELRPLDEPPRVATVAYLVRGETKYGVLASLNHPLKGLRASLRLPHPPDNCTKVLRRGLTERGAECVANRARAVALAVRRLS
jgi:hypothetical protein